MSIMMPVTGVVQVPEWSAKAWWSRRQQLWLVQIERNCPDRGGWIRGWLTSAIPGQPQTFATLAMALAATEAFCVKPTETTWQENYGVL